MNKYQHVLSVFAWRHVGLIVQSNETGVMLLYQKTHVGTELFYDAKTSFFWFEKIA